MKLHTLLFIFCLNISTLLANPPKMERYLSSREIQLTQSTYSQKAIEIRLFENPTANSQLLIESTGYFFLDSYTPSNAPEEAKIYYTLEKNSKTTLSYSNPTEATTYVDYTANYFPVNTAQTVYWKIDKKFLSLPTPHYYTAFVYLKINQKNKFIAGTYKTNFTIRYIYTN